MLLGSGGEIVVVGGFPAGLLVGVVATTTGNGAVTPLAENGALFVVGAVL
jgi:hypothetical protein